MRPAFSDSLRGGDVVTGAADTGPPGTKLVLVGHSHIQALRAAAINDAGLLSDPRRRVEVEFLRLGVPEATVMYSDARLPVELVQNWLRDARRFRERAHVVLSDADHIFLLWHGGQFTGRMTFAVGPDFDVVMPDAVDVAPSPDVELFAYSVLEEWAETIFAAPGYETICELLAPYAKAGRVSYLAPPPPLPSSVLRERLRDSPGAVALAERLDLNLDSARLVDDGARVKAWRSMLRTYERHATRQGSVLIPPPDESFDADGRLASQYWGPDVTHANLEYGRLYLDKMVMQTVSASR